MHGRLNPYAKEFVPSSHNTTVPSHPKKDIKALSRINAPEIIHDIPPLPTEVIAKIASFLYHPQDLCYLLLGAKQLLTAAQEARVRLKLTNS